MALVVVLAGACHRSPKPSPEYTQATQQFSQLYAEKLDDAYLDPAMSEVESLLQKVPSDSMDAQGAQDLLKRIRDNRARLQAEQAQREKESAVEPSSGPVTFSPSLIPAPPDAGTPDAGSRPVPRIGMTVQEFEQKFSRCFEQGQQVLVQDRGPADTYGLKDVTTCRDLYPEYTQYVLVARNGKIEGMVNRSDLVRKYEDGGVVPDQDAGAASDQRSGAAANPATNAPSDEDAGASTF